MWSLNTAFMKPQVVSGRVEEKSHPCPSRITLTNIQFLFYANWQWTMLQTPQQTPVLEKPSTTRPAAFFYATMTLCSTLAWSKGMWSEIIELFYFLPVSVLWRSAALRHKANTSLIQACWLKPSCQRRPFVPHRCVRLHSDSTPPSHSAQYIGDLYHKRGCNSKLLLDRQKEGMWLSLFLFLFIAHIN